MLPFACGKYRLHQTSLCSRLISLWQVGKIIQCVGEVKVMTKAATDAVKLLPEAFPGQLYDEFHHCSYLGHITVKGIVPPLIIE